MLGDKVGPEVGSLLGSELGCALGALVGPELGCSLGSLLGAVLGTEVGRPLGLEDVILVGPVEGAMLEVGSELGAGLMLGIELGGSVGHDTVFPKGEGVLSESRQIPIWVIAVAPNKVTSILAMNGSSRTIFLYAPAGNASTLTVLVAPSASVS